MNVRDILGEYQGLPEYSGLPLKDVNQISLFGDFPLHIAAVRGSLNEINVLLDSGAKIDAKGEEGYTPLLNAIEQRNLSAVRLLLSRGADPNIRNIHDENAMSLAENLGYSDVSMVIKEYSG